MANTSPDPPSTPSNEDGGDPLRDLIEARRLIAHTKHAQLKLRIAAEDAALDELTAEYRITPSLALESRMISTRDVLDSIKRNFNLAVDEFEAGYHVETLGMAMGIMEDVERRLMAVEVGLKGIGRERPRRGVGGA